MTVTSTTADLLASAVRAKAEARYADEAALRQEIIDNIPSPAASVSPGTTTISTQQTAIAVAKAASHVLVTQGT